MTSLCSTADTLVWVCDTAIDWSATGDFWSGIGTMVGAVAVFVTAAKAADTINYWKAQKLAELKIDQAGKILTAVYEAKDALEYARGVMTWAYELDKAREEAEKFERWGVSLPAERDRLVTAQARLNRLNQIRDKQKALVERLPMAKALWNDELRQALTDFHHQFWVLETYIQAYVDDEQGVDADFTKRIREGMYAINPESEISAKVSAAITTIEEHCLSAFQLGEVAQPVGWKLWKKWTG